MPTGRPSLIYAHLTVQCHWTRTRFLDWKPYITHLETSHSGLILSQRRCYLNEAWICCLIDIMNIEGRDAVVTLKVDTLIWTWILQTQHEGYTSADLSKNHIIMSPHRSIIDIVPFCSRWLNGSWLVVVSPNPWSLEMTYIRTRHLEVLEIEFEW